MYAQVMKSSDAAKKAWATRKAKAGGASDTPAAKAPVKPAVTSKNQPRLPPWTKPLLRGKSSLPLLRM